MRLRLKAERRKSSFMFAMISADGEQDLFWPFQNGGYNPSNNIVLGTKLENGMAFPLSLDEFSLLPCKMISWLRILSANREYGGRDMCLLYATKQLRRD